MKSEELVANDADVFIQASGMVRLELVCRVLQILTTLYAVLLALPPPVGVLEGVTKRPSICPRFSICSEGWIEVALLVVARLTAYWMMVPIAVVFVTKARLLLARWNETLLSLIMPGFALHELHVKMGKEIGVLSVIHTIAHVARFAKRGTLGRISMGTIGFTGWVAIASFVPVIVLQLQFLRSRTTFEMRKPAHMVGAVVFAAACLGHGANLPFVALIAFIIYALDFLYATFVVAQRIDNSEFVRLGRGVELTFKDPPNWPKDKTAEGYVNVLVPWISLWQWHPFSVYKSFDRPGYSSIFAMDSGDWTSALHASIARDTKRPVWIQGPFPSPYGERAVDFDNMVLVATGIGVTPALSCIQSFGKTGRSLSLIWSCRDPGLIAYYAERRLEATAMTLIYYTGKAPINLTNLPSHIRVIPSRPDLKRVVPDIIRCVEYHVALPKELQTKAAHFLMEASEVYGGLHECSQDSARLRFDALISSCLKRGTSPHELVEHFFQYDNSASAWAQQGAEVTSMGHPSHPGHDQGDGMVAVAAPPPFFAGTPFHTKRPKSIELEVHKSPSSPVSAHMSWRRSIGAGFAAGAPTEDTASVDIESTTLNAVAFSRAFAALATNIITLTTDEVIEIMRTISMTGDDLVTRDELATVFEMRQKLNDARAEQEEAARAALKMKRSTSGNSLTNMFASRNNSRHELSKEGGGDLEMGAPISRNTSANSLSKSVESGEFKVDIESVGMGIDGPDLTGDEEESKPLLVSYRRWGMMYCGGSSVVQGTLQDLSKDLGIPLFVDKFDW